jgi:2-aminobenzoate-CoA ligase
VEKTRPVVALVDHRFTEEVETVRDTVAGGLVVVPYGGDTDADLTRRVASKPGEYRGVDTAADDVALLGPTSGSTGVPKVTMHFHRDLLSIDNTFGRHILRLEPDDVVACTAPFAFTFGLGMLVVFTLRAGACALLTESTTPVQLAEVVEQHGVTVLATAPTAYKQIIRGGHLARLAGLRKAVSAGEHLPQEVWQRIRSELGLSVIDGIGATEMLHIFISAPEGEMRPGSTGRPVPGYRATILGPDSTPVPPGTEGRLAVIGPVGCRYLDDDRQYAYVVDGWNVTGDTFVEDEDGYFFYRARTDSMIVSSGYNIGAPEVEEAIDAHPDVVETGVVGEPDPERGSVVSAFVVLREGVVGDEAKAREIQEFVKATLAPYKYPRRVRFVEQLPRNTSGKLQHYKLRELVKEMSS